jgi:phosphomannomutase/phosphoglucomutase
LSGPELAGALALGITQAGIDVIDIGRVPTPLSYFAAYELSQKQSEIGCVSVTGSHNPPDYNDMAFTVRSALGFYAYLWAQC